MLVIAVSGRILTQAARREGKPVRVMDRFGDLDTRAAAREFRTEGSVGGPDAGDNLLAAVERFSPASRSEPVVWAGGMEGQPGLLERLAEEREVLGNPPEQVRRLQDPGAWMALLDRLGLPYPETRLSPPPRHETGWLTKGIGASGGWHIHPAAPGEAEPGRYFQRLVRGRAYSVVFAADGREAQVLGISEQWTTREQSGHVGDFRYGGVLGPTPVSPERFRELTEAVRALTFAMTLRGLNGLDFVADDEHGFHLLEVNPRPVASLDLYREGISPGPFFLHIRGSRGSLPPTQVHQPGFYRGHAVVYSDRPIRIPRGLLGHPWCGDRPPPGTHFPAGVPVCTVHACHRDREAARRQLWDRHRWVRERFEEAGDRPIRLSEEAYP